MANMYTAMEIPRRELLEDLYHGQNMTQQEVGEQFGVTQRVVHNWFKKLGIQSRVAAKRNQTGEANSSWRGDAATYAALHYRVQAVRGRPKKCEECLTEAPSTRYEWANISGNYADPSDYRRLCKKCHIHFDDVPAKSSATQKERRSRLV